MKRYFVLLGLLLCCSLAFADIDLTGLNGTVTFCDGTQGWGCSSFGTTAPDSFTVFTNAVADVTVLSNSITLTFNQDATAIDATFQIVFNGVSGGAVTVLSGNISPAIIDGSMTNLDITAIFSGDYHVGDTVTIGAPEPASLLLLAFGLPFLKRRHQA